MVNREFGVQSPEAGSEDLGREIFACFIGIDTFQAPSARQLSGCRRDAMAFNALFADTLPNVRAELLVNEKATKEAILVALDASLGAAGPDDSVIVTISTHGTADHRLVTYDSRLDKCAESTIGMADLADRFKQSKAKVVLCVLDCCFAGGASARVWQGTPTPRSPIPPIEFLGGVGRLFIAASNLNEPAYEKDNHGLLTRALLEALWEEGSDLKNLTVVIDAVMRRVRAQAESMGYVQSPVLIGNVEKSLDLPRLRRGLKFYAAFPEECDKTIRQLLAPHDFPDLIFEQWEKDGQTHPLPLQTLAIANGAIFGKSCLIVGPTSSGKTFVGEIVAVSHILRLRKCIYLVPTKALAEEKFESFRSRYGGPSVGATIVLSTADRREFDKAIMASDYDIAIMTYEKLSALLVLRPPMVHIVGVLVVDEIQMVADDSRGAELELLLTRCQQLAPKLQIVGLSAVVAELNGFDRWLRAEVLANNHRPVALREGAISPDGECTYVEWIGVARNPGGEMFPPIQGRTKEERAIALTAKFLQQTDEQVLVFVQSVAETQKLAKGIAAACAHLPPAMEALSKLATMEDSEVLDDLRGILAKSIAFHNGDMTLEERLAVEAGFRSRLIRCVVSTSTLAMGVNLPASTVVIASTEKFVRTPGDWTTVPLTVSEYRNMAGRAGRLGLHPDPLGRSMLIADSPLNRMALMRTLVHDEPKPLTSALSAMALELLVLRILATRLCDTEPGVHQFLRQTFAASSGAMTGIGTDIHEKIVKLQRAELVSVNSEHCISVTDDGIICAASGLSIETFTRLARFVANNGREVVDIARVASVGAETGPNAISLRMSGAESRSAAPSYIAALQDAVRTFGGNMTRKVLEDLPEGSAPAYVHVHAFKYQAIAIAYVTGASYREIESRLFAPSARIRAIGGMCTWLCDVLSKLARVRNLHDEASHYEMLGRRFQIGCTEKALFLADVGRGLHRADREALVSAGFDSLQKIIDTNSVEIARIARVAKGRIDTLQAAIIERLGDSLELERSQAARLGTIGRDVRLLEALYMAKGTALDQAIESVLVPPFCPLVVSRISLQREGEADLKIQLSDGMHGIAHVTARENSGEGVSTNSAGVVLQQSPELRPTVFIAFGRPDFLEEAIRNARAHVEGGKNYKLIPIRVLAEMYVRFWEGRLSADRVRQLLEEERGYIDLERIQRQ